MKKDYGCLIIERDYGERFFIGNDITVSILDKKGKTTRLAITAPLSTKIVREEIADINHPLKAPALKEGVSCEGKHQSQ